MGQTCTALLISSGSMCSLTEREGGKNTDCYAYCHVMVMNSVYCVLIEMWSSLPQGAISQD